MKASFCLIALVSAFCLGAVPSLSQASDDDEALSVSLFKSMSHKYTDSSASLFPSIMQLSGDRHSVLCDGHEISDAATGKFECWGSFYWKYKNASSFMAAMCDGHFLYISAPSSSKIVACEGLHHSFGKFQKTCPKTGGTVLKFFGTGCLGTSSSIMSSAITQGDDSSKLHSSVDAQLLSSGFKRPDPQLQHELKMLTAPQVDALDSYGGSVESRCDGRGGVMHGTKWGATDTSDEKEAHTVDVQHEYESLRDIVDSQLGPMAYEPLNARHDEHTFSKKAPEAEDSAPWRERLQPVVQPAPAHGNLISAMLKVTAKSTSTATESSATSNNEASCEVTCNGKPAWFHGMWPCWGILNVSCSKGEESRTHTTQLVPAHVTKTSTVLTSDSAETTRVMPKTSAAATARRYMRSVSSDGAAQSSSPVKVAGSGSFSAACKGVWTGYLGKMCLGLTMQHIEASWPNGSVDSFWVCSGKLGVRMHEGPDYASSGHSCGGNEVSRMVYSKK